MEVHNHETVENWDKEQLESHEHFTDAVIHCLKYISDKHQEHEFLDKIYGGKGITPQGLARFINNSGWIKVVKYDDVKEQVSVSRIQQILHTYWDGTDYVERNPTHQILGSTGGRMYEYKYITTDELEAEKNRKDELRQKMIDAGITEI